MVVPVGNTEAVMVCLQEDRFGNSIAIGSNYGKNRSQLRSCVSATWLFYDYRGCCGLNCEAYCPLDSNSIGVAM